MRYLGLDLGSKTLGIAISDTMGVIANSYGVVRHDNDYDSLILKIKDLVETKNIDEIVLGLPKNMNNTIGEKAKLSYEFKDKIEKELNIKVNLIDERLTTKQATDLLISNDTSRKKRKKVIDSMAACIILQSYLDMKGKN